MGPLNDLYRIDHQPSAINLQRENDLMNNSSHTNAIQSRIISQTPEEALTGLAAVLTDIRRVLELDAP